MIRISFESPFCDGKIYLVINEQPNEWRFKENHMAYIPNSGGWILCSGDQWEPGIKVSKNGWRKYLFIRNSKWNELKDPFYVLNGINPLTLGLLIAELKAILAGPLSPNFLTSEDFYKEFYGDVEDQWENRWKEKCSLYDSQSFNV